MLKSSPVATSLSPRFHPYQYGHLPSKTANQSIRRRHSIALKPSPSLPPRRQAVRYDYVDRGTQWSPNAPMMDVPCVESAPIQLEKSPSIPQEDRSKETASEKPATNENQPIPPPPAEPILEGQSPNTKRREPPEEVPLAHTQNQDILPQRNVRPRPAQPVKILPLKYELCEVEDMVILIANMISELIERNDTLPLRQGVLTRFHSRTPPGISVLAYLQRLAKHATLSPPLLLSMVYYIDRLCSLYPAFTMTTLTVHRFLITAATVAAKGLSDSFWNNATYARVGGIKIAELGLLELDFLYRVDWKIVPQPEILVDYYKGLVARSGGYVLEDTSAESSSDEEEDEDDLDYSDEKETVESPEAKAEATEEKWQEWMDDVAGKKDGENNPN